MLNLTMRVEYADKPTNRKLSDWEEGAYFWKVHLRVTLGKRRWDRKLTVPYWTGTAIGEPRKAKEVLACLLSDGYAGRDTFENFCSDFGYDPDSRNAERIYRECQKMDDKVEQFLGPHRRLAERLCESC